MVFNSFSFLVFLVLILGLYQVPFAWHRRKGLLLVASYYFYAAFSIAFLPVLLFTTVVDWIATSQMAHCETKSARRGWLVLSLASNLGLLGFFKYGNFLQENLVRLLGSMGVEYHPAVWHLVLPAGISFYTFQSLSYTIDIYRRTCPPARSFLDFALYVSFFPQLVAGPIVRAADFLPQLAAPRTATRAQFNWGLLLLIFGLAQKIVFADAILSPVVTATYDAKAALGTLDAWAGTLAFAGQIFFDFSGYSTCAIGVAMCFGFALPDNFRHPYAAAGFSDFWQRWHISLSTWLRDYLYIPLGGNRRGLPRTYANLFVTMLLGGLWHGADWRFVVWGGLHALYLSGERVLITIWPARLLPWPRMRLVGAMALTFLLVCITWVFFRAPSFPRAGEILAAMFSARANESMLDPGMLWLAMAVVLGLVGYQWTVRDLSAEQIWTRLPRWQQAFATAAALFLIASLPVQQKAFIYFQF
ncbi:MAG: MBOAT family O-acyltransferase [Chthoniobacterales bacterium]